MLKLERPLVIFDLETTGINTAKDRIVEISLLKVLPEGGEESLTQRIHPEIPIPLESTHIHGIGDEDVAKCPKFKDFAPRVLEFIANSDLAGYNSNRFDLPLLAEEFLRAGFDFDPGQTRMVDVQQIFHQMEPRTLAAAYLFYCDKELEGAHSAEADVQATYRVLLAQIKRYENREIRGKSGHLKKLENTVASLSAFGTVQNAVDLSGRVVLNEQSVEVFNFGKHKGISVKEVFKKEPSYYHWIMKGDFSQFTKKVITRLYHESRITSAT